MPVKLGELLLTEHVITPEQLQAGLNHQKETGGRLGQALVSLGFVEEEALIRFLSQKLGVPSVDLHEFEVDPAIIKIIPAKTAHKYQVLPLSLSGKTRNTLTIAMDDPTNVFAMDDIKFMTGYNVEPALASHSQLKEFIDRHYGPARSPEPRRETPAGSARAIDGPALTAEDMAGIGSLSDIDVDSMAKTEVDIDLAALSKSADAGPLIMLANVILVDSLKRGASDIHMEPYENEFRIRFRIDGILYNVMTLPMLLRDPLTFRIKTMARLNIAERRLPQDGRIKIKMKVEDRTRDLDFRVSVMPTLWGEKIVMRLLDKSKLMLDMTTLGFEPHPLECFRNALARHCGLVLIVGPIGSGKTTTLYSAIASLNNPDTNIMTAEDPVEFGVPGVNQVQVRGDIGLASTAVSYCFTRQDPDVMVIGQIRDYDTAKAAANLAARAGRLVLATMNERDCASSFEALREAEVHPLVLGRALSLVVAQRLVRRLCEECKADVTAHIPPQTLIDIGVSPDEVASLKVFGPKGCGSCNGTGYLGRVGLFEVMEITEGIRDLIKAGATSAEIKKKALEERMVTLQQSGVEKLKAGITSLDEMLRETAC